MPSPSLYSGRRSFTNGNSLFVAEWSAGVAPTVPPPQSRFWVPFLGPVSGSRFWVPPLEHVVRGGRPAATARGGASALVFRDPVLGAPVLGDPVLGDPVLGNAVLGDLCISRLGDEQALAGILICRLIPVRSHPWTTGHRPQAQAKRSAGAAARSLCTSCPPDGDLTHSP